ncbi:hypothetical protein BKA66DRAFT_455428, partial [Pyrenochaeta sp. MPI-SDFR-AT-0127]
MKELKLSTYQRLSRAVLHNDLKSVRRLLESEPIVKGGFLLSKCKDTSIAEFLIHKGAKLEAKNTRGRTPLARCREIQVARILVDVTCIPS